MRNTNAYKTELARDIISLKSSSMQMSCTQIANNLNCSREYVRLVLQYAGLPTKRLKQQCVCIQCGEPISCYNTTELCRNCYANSHRVVLKCMWCGMNYTVVKSVYKTRQERHKHNFCSKSCLGKFAGTHYGFGAKTNGTKNSKKGGKS